MCLLFAIKWPYNELLHIVPLQGLIKVEGYVEVLYCVCISSNTSTRAPQVVGKYPRN